MSIPCHRSFWAILAICCDQARGLSLDPFELGTVASDKAWTEIRTQFYVDDGNASPKHEKLVLQLELLHSQCPLPRSLQ